MRIDERDDYIDIVAQAVVDRMEERDRISSLVNMVVQRVIELQREEAAAQPEEIIQDIGNGNHTNNGKEIQHVG